MVNSLFFLMCSKSKCIQFRYLLKFVNRYFPTVDSNLFVFDSMIICSVDDRIAVRLEFDIPPQEKEFLKKRKLIVGQNMQKLFGLDSPPSASQVKNSSWNFVLFGSFGQGQYKSRWT